VSSEDNTKKTHNSVTHYRDEKKVNAKRINNSESTERRQEGSAKATENAEKGVGLNKNQIMDEIRFAMQELSDNTTLTIAIIFGVFGVLTSFSISESIILADKPLSWSDSLAWRELGKDTILSVIYWSLILFGLKCIVDRRIFFLHKDNLIKDLGLGYNELLKNRAVEDGWLTRTSVKHTWAVSGETDKSLNKFIYRADLRLFIIFYILIAFFLWFFVAAPLEWFFLR
jgi:hypothetical protein